METTNTVIENANETTIDLTKTMVPLDGKVKSPDGKYFLMTEQDTMATNPNEWGQDLGKIIFFGNDKPIGDDHDYESFSEVRDDIETQKNTLGARAFVCPLSIYEHGGMNIRMYTSRSDFDSRNSGIAYILEGVGGAPTKEEKLSDEEFEKQCSDILSGRIKNLNSYINGEVYEISLYKVNKCDHCGHAESDYITSISDMYLDYPCKLSLADVFDGIDLAPGVREDVLKSFSHTIVKQK